jgi:hypothetical protein
MSNVHVYYHLALFEVSQSSHFGEASSVEDEAQQPLLLPRPALQKPDFFFDLPPLRGGLAFVGGAGYTATKSRASPTLIPNPTNSSSEVLAQ